MKVVDRSKDVIFSKPDSFLTMAASISEDEIENTIKEADIQKISETFKEMSETLYNAPDTNSFLKIFSSLPGIFKALILFMILNVFIAQLNSISANLLTPYVENFLIENVLPKREQINHIEKLPTTIEVGDTTNLRFITGDNVRLRKLPSTKSQILDELVFGQIVTVLHKKRNWMEVSYEYDDGEIMQGWVFTRYTAKFKNRLTTK